MVKITSHVAQELSVRIQSFVLSLDAKQKDAFIGLLAQIMLVVISTEEVPDEQPVKPQDVPPTDTTHQKIAHEPDLTLTTRSDESISTTVETTAETSTPSPDLVAECELEPPAMEPTPPSTHLCRNRRRSDTGQQCPAQVPITNWTWGLCPECLHPCQGCGKIIPIFYTRCKPCKALAIPEPTATAPQSQQAEAPTKVCRECDTLIPVDGPAYCAHCGHKCATCDAVIPYRFSYCMAQACQDEKWLQEHPPTSRQGLSAGALAHRAHKKARAAEQSQSVKDARKARGIKK